VKIVIFGLSITSSWGNGHATTYRALSRALRTRGHEIVFFERNAEWYASNRDMPEPPFCDVRVYEHWAEVVAEARSELRDCDVAMVGSYFPDGIAAIDEVLNSRAPLKIFYDIDTPITVSKLRSGDAEYLAGPQVKGFDLYFSFTGGPMLRELESRFGAQRAVPLYCSFDPEQYRSCPVARFRCDMNYMGTYAADRQPKVEELFCTTARKLPYKKFILAGPQYPDHLAWPRNVMRIVHLEPKFHASFYSSSRLTLNVTRREMVEAGYSPSVRLFEAAACGTTIVSDRWDGLDTFFVPGEEILLPESASDVMHYLFDMDEAEIKQIGNNAQARVLAEHTAQRRAQQFEEHVGSVAPRSNNLAAVRTATRVHN
jgi:spore maturation protein CgeB